MSKFRFFPRGCQYKNNNSSIIIVPNVIYPQQLLSTNNLAAKHLMVLCYSLLHCWRNQPAWSGEQRPALDSMLSRPLKAKMIELNYKRLGKALSLTSDQLKNILVDLEQAKLLKRVLIKNNWYLLLLDEAFKMYLNNNKSKKSRINKGNIISTSWLNSLKTDGGQTDFTGALILGEVTYFSRVLKMKQSADDYNAKLDEPTREVTAEHNSSITNKNNHSSLVTTKQQNLLPLSNASNNDQEDCTKLISKSKGLVAYFEYDHFKKKFPFIDNQTINRTLSRLEKNNVISIERIKFVQNRRVVKRMYITLDYELIQQGVEKTVVDFIFKTNDFLTKEQLTSFYQNTPASIYSKYNNKTIIYPWAGFSNNFASFSSLLSSSCLSTVVLTKPPEHVIHKKWYQVAYLDNDDDDDHDSDGNDDNSSNTDDDNSSSSTLDEMIDGVKDAAKRKPSKYRQISSLSSIESFWSKKRAFKVPRYLSEMHSSLRRLYRAYFASFNYPLSFCCSLLDSLAKKYPSASFRGENQFIKYFRIILSQEKRASWLVRSRQYFGKALGLVELAYDKLPGVVRDKLHQLTTRAGKKIEELPELLCKLAIRNAKHMFACVSSFLAYMKQVLSKLKSKEEIQEAYKALPRVKIAEVASYLSSVEASYSRIGPQEHLRRKLACTLPMTIAYHVLHNCNFYSAKVDKDKNFIIPSKNKNWAEMIRGGLKNIIKDQVSAVYGQIKAIKFVQVLRKEEAGKKLTKSEDALGVNNTGTWAIKTVAKSINTQRPPAGSGSKEYQSSSVQNEPTSYHLFQQRRIEFEQREKEKLEAKMRNEEKVLKATGVRLEVYEKYKQVVEETEREREKYIQRGGVKELARELYKVLSFREWIQLQELMGMV